MCSYSEERRGDEGKRRESQGEEGLSFFIGRGLGLVCQ